jgi:hypothetical protein
MKHFLFLLALVAICSTSVFSQKLVTAVSESK